MTDLSREEADMNPMHMRAPSTMRLGSAGYILIEGLVSMMVVAAGILGVAKLQSAIVTASADAKATSAAYSVGRAKLEELRTTTIAAQHSGTGCTPGTVVKSGADTVTITGMETAYSRSWSVTTLKNKDNKCDAARHKVSVTVSWQTRERSRNITLNSIVAWNNPLAVSQTTGSGGTGGGGGPGAKPTTAKFVPDNYTYEVKENLATFNDRASIVLSKAGEYILTVDNKAKIASTVPFVRLSGLVALDQNTATKAQTSILNISVYRTDVTYCLYPLPFTNENDPTTYGLRPGSTGGTTAATDTAAAYVCYVPEGWRGNIGLLQKSTNCSTRFNLFDGTSKIDSCNFTDDLACPGGQEGSAFLSGVRNIKTLIRTNGTITGASGVMPSHEALGMPNYYPPLTQTMRLDFVVFQPSDKGKDKISACNERFPTAGNQTSASKTTGSAPAAYTVFRRSDEWLGLTATGQGIGTEGVPSLVYTQHVLANDASNLRTISGTASGCSGVKAAGKYPYSNIDCPLVSGTYSCKVPYGWNGTLTATPNPTPPSISITPVVNDLINQDFVCTPP